MNEGHRTFCLARKPGIGVQDSAPSLAQPEAGRSPHPTSVSISRSPAIYPCPPFRSRLEGGAQGGLRAAPGTGQPPRTLVPAAPGSGRTQQITRDLPAPRNKAHLGPALSAALQPGLTFPSSSFSASLSFPGSAPRLLGSPPPKPPNSRNKCAPQPCRWWTPILTGWSPAPGPAQDPGRISLQQLHNPRLLCALLQGRDAPTGSGAGCG